MDRNSLLAFLLIAVIIFLLPEYYKLVYPSTPAIHADWIQTGALKRLHSMAFGPRL